MDHIVLNVKDDEKMIAFYSEVVCLGPERLVEYRAGQVPFPFVRLNANTVIDLFPKRMWQRGEATGRSGQNLNHFCMALGKGAWQELLERLENSGVTIEDGPIKRWGGARHGDMRLFSRSGRQHDRSTVLRGGGRLGQMPAGIVAEAAFVRTGVEAGS